MTGNLARHIEAFFTERLLQQRQASEHTIESYRDSFRLLLRFAHSDVGKEPSQLNLCDIDGPLVGRFLQHLENDRGNKAQSRNVRLAAIHSFFRFLAFREPAMSNLVQRVLAIPTKRRERRQVQHLTRAEADAVIAAPDLATRIGRRDRALVLTAIQTGLRVSELVHLKRCDVHLGHGAHIRCLGKGRKERCTPLRGEVVQVLQKWMHENRGSADDPLFPSERRARLSTDAVRDLLAKHVAAASRECPSLAGKRVSPHVLRHTAAVSLLEAGVDQAVIALWLGHESADTTKVYLQASLQIKERALARTRPAGVRGTRFRPTDRLLAFLEGL